MKKLLLTLPLLFLLVGCGDVPEEVSDAAAGINKATPAVNEADEVLTDETAEVIENNNINTAVSAE